MRTQLRRPGNSRNTNIKRSCALIAATLAATLLAAPAAGAVTTIGAGTTPRPGVGVDAAGTAYIAWNGQQNAQAVAPLHFCRLPRGATACDVASSIVTPGPGGLRPFITVSGERVVVVQNRSGAGVPGFSAVYAYTSTDRGVSFGTGRVVGSVPFLDAVTGPGATMSGVGHWGGHGMAFQNVPLDGTDPQVDISGASTRPWALLSTTHPLNGTVALLDASTPLVVSVSPSGDGQASRYDGSGSLNDVTNWTQPISIGKAEDPRLAGGSSGLFLMDDSPVSASGLSVRKWTGSDFGAPVSLGAGIAVRSHLFQDAAGRLHAVYQTADGSGRYLIHAVSDDGTAWRTGTLATETNPGHEFDHMRVATAPDHIGVAVWVGGAREVRVAPLGPDAPAGAVTPPPPPATVKPPPPPVAPRPVVKPKPAFTSTGSAKRLGRRVRIRIKGELLPPAGVPDAKACKGTVIVTVRRAGKLVVTRTLKIDKHCEFGFTALVKKSKVNKARKLALRIQFLGNDALAAAAKLGSINVKR